jgi:tRNA threonylcarbamoyladenosine biosynthesis protein TsaE
MHLTLTQVYYTTNKKKMHSIFERKNIYVKSEEETRALGRELAEGLKAGDIVALIGDLGTGKTALTRYIAEALGVKEPVTSPTFTIVREHKDGRLPLYHFDVYRVYDPDELYEIGFEEYLFGGGVCIIEWADLIEDLLPAGTLIINIKRGEGETEREYSFAIKEG